MKRCPMKHNRKFYVTRIINSTREHLDDFSEDKRDELSGCKVVLGEKMDALGKLDDEIVEYLSSEEALEVDIGSASDLRCEIQLLLVVIDSKSKKPDSEPSSIVKRTPKRSNHAKLPKLTLNSYLFQSFWDNFKAAVHETGELEKIMKFNYLRSYLHGPALSAIAGLSLIAENYDEAVKIIKYRFEDKQLLISSNMDNLLLIPVVNSAQNVASLRDVYNKIETYATNLKALNIDRNQYDDDGIGGYVKITTRDKIDSFHSMPLNNEWDIELLLETLKKEIESREICYHMSSKKTPPVSFSEAKRKDDAEEGEEHFTGSTLISAGSRYGDQKGGPRFEDRKVSWPYCRRNHSSSKCDVITDVNGRKAILRRKATYFVCLNPGHIARHCTSTWKCFKCRGRHHISICEQPKFQDGQYNQNQDFRVSSHTGVTTTHHTTLLQTAQANISNNGTSKTTRVLFDSGSQDRL